MERIISTTSAISRRPCLPERIHLALAAAGDGLRAPGLIERAGRLLRQFLRRGAELFGGGGDALGFLCDDWVDVRAAEAARSAACTADSA